MVEKQCMICGLCFETRDKRRKFCSVICYRESQRRNPNRGTFKRGIIPWNTGTVGVMKPNSGSFIKGRLNENKAEIGAVTIRNDKNGTPRAWVKIADNSNPYDWILRAVLVWTQVNGLVPDGKVIHHIDHDSLNDAIDNLKALTREEHIDEHRDELRKSSSNRRPVQNASRTTSGMVRKMRDQC